MNDLIAKTAENAIGKNREQVGCKGNYAWCARFVSNVLIDAGIKGIDTASCTDMFNTMKNKPGEWSEPDDYPERGDILFFDWNKDVKEEKPLDHVGIVTEYNPLSKRVYYVNGNGSSDTLVTRQDMSISNQSIAYWLRYIGDNNDRYAEIEKQLIELKNKINKIRSILDN